MDKTISIVGGDYRIVKLVEMLRKDKYKIYTYGLENNTEIFEEEKCINLEECLKNSKIVISSIPFSKDGKTVYMPFSDKMLEVEKLKKYSEEKTIIAGNIKKIFLNRTKIYDLMQNESLTIANAISTAEGAIQIAMEETEITIHNSKILILGFGRIGKILAKNLHALGAKVTCEARKQEDIAWIKAYGYDALWLKDLKENLHKYKIIFNTVPYLILDKEKIKKINKNCIIIDLASNPGGVDFEECNRLEIKNIWALALPGKVAPVTSAKEIYNIIKGEIL